MTARGTGMPATVMMLTLDDALIDDTTKITAACDDIAAAGFAGVAPMVRCSRHAWNDDAAIEALCEVQRCCRARHAAFWLIADPRGLSLGVLDAFDGAEVLLFGDAVRAEQIPQLLLVRDGRFEGSMSIAPRPVHTMPAERIDYHPLGIERAYALRGRECSYAETEVRDITRDVHMLHDAGSQRVVVSGAFSPPDDAEWYVLVFLRCATTHFDFSNAAHVEACCAALSLLAARGLQPDGLLWDEAGYTCMHGSLPAGPWLDATGDAAARALWPLAVDAADGSHLALRIAAYRAIQDSILTARSRVNMHARALWGEDLLLGMHDTWRWESADPADAPHGTLDLWRGLPTKSCGFTDIGSVQLTAETDSPFHANLAMAILTAASLGRHSATRSATVNLWLAGEDARDGVADEVLDHCIDLLALQGCGWIGHLYGPAGPRHAPRSFFGLPFTPGYPHHESWARMPKRTARLAAHLAAVDHRLPDAALAVLFPVETVLALEPFRARHVMEDVFRLVLALTDAQYAVHVVGSSVLADARWNADGTLCIEDVRCRALVAPHPQVLDAETLRLLAAGADRVLRVFSGTSYDERGARVPEKGRVCGDFIELLGALAAFPELRRVQGPARAWVSSTRLDTHELITLLPARRGWCIEGELRVDDLCLMIPRTRGLVRVRHADGVLRIEES